MPTSDWSFARRPPWLLSHLLALAAVAVCVLAGLWQLDRLDQRQRANELIEARTALPAGTVADALAAGGSPAELDYVPVRDEGTYLAEEQVVVRNRSQGGAAGSWVVTPLRTTSGETILVNRGFVPDVTLAPGEVPVPEGVVGVAGWLRQSQERGGFGPRHPEEGRLQALARVDVARLDAQVPADLAPVWLQLGSQEPPPADGLPAPVPLPALDEGNHLSYAVQWFSFAALTAVVYGVLLRHRARGRTRAAAQPVAGGVG